MSFTELDNGFLVWDLTKLWGFQVFVRKVIELHDKYLAYVNDCFMNHTLFHKVCTKKLLQGCDFHPIIPVSKSFSFASGTQRGF